MSIVSMSPPSCAYISEVIMIASSDTVGDSEYSLFMCCHFFLPSTRVLLLILPSFLCKEHQGL